MESLARLGAQQLMVLVISAMSAFMAVDLWQRSARAARALDEGGPSARRAVGWGLLTWFGATLALTLIAPLRDFANAATWFRPVVMAISIAGVTALALLPAFRRAFDSLPWEQLLTFSYWRAIFGAALLALYAGGFFPAAFGLPAGLGDIATTFLMIPLLVFSQRLDRIPRPALLLWNTVGLLDLVNVQFLFVTVLRPWLAERGQGPAAFTLVLFAVPLFIALHLHMYARVVREWRRRYQPQQTPAGAR